MSVEIIKGDLFETDCQVIGHQVNCKGVIGSGVALQVRKKYPIAYRHYLARSEISNVFGTVGVVKVSDNLHIANIYSQDSYGYDGEQYTSLIAFENALKLLNRTMRQIGLTSVALPYKIGCVRGGADWNMVSSIIEKTLGYNLTVKLYQLDKG